MNYGYNPHIRDLPPEIQELAHRRQMEQGNDGTYDGSMGDGKSGGNFNWDETPEEKFWSDLYDGDMDIEDHPDYPNKSLNYQIY